MLAQKRRLAAIMFTDIQGYTAIMQQDESHALQMRKRHREIFNTTTHSHQGEILQYYGDGTLSIFSSVIEAVNCAVEMQRLFQKDPQVPVRIGIHLGDIVVAEDEVIGDAVNVASRIESIAVVGAVLVSEGVHQEIKNHENIHTRSLGHFSFKNVQQPMEIFAITGDGLVIPDPQQMLHKGKVDQPTPNNLPRPVTHFFGREQELEKVKTLLAQHRLVTLQGSGGCGKTRLAIETARLLSDHFPQGIWFIGLAPVTDPDLVSITMAEILHIKPEKGKPIEDTIAKRISDQKMLIVVDNCEHLIDTCARILDFLMGATSEPKVLATSRETIDVTGEAVYRIPPLAVPQTTAGVDEALTFDSVQLFRDRALLNKPDFQVNEHNSASVTAICQKLEGIPLALEMAASRIKVMDPDTLLARLSNQFRLLSRGSRFAPPHQQTMRATIDWSYQLLSEDEKVLFDRLSVFSGTFDLEDVEGVCSYTPLTEFQVLDLLTGLVDKSMVITEDKKGATRYNLLEVMKQYGWEKVLQNADSERLQQRYQKYYLDQATLAFQERLRYGDKWSSWLSGELPNLIGVLSLLERQPDKRLRLASLLGEVFFMHAKIGTGQKILSSALKAAPERNLDRARALCALGFVEILIDPESGYKKMKEGIAIIQEMGDRQAKLDTYWRYGSFIGAYKEWDEARKFLEEGLQIAREMDDPWMVLRYKNNLAWIAITQLKPELIEDEIEGNLKEALRLGNNYDIIDAYHMSADVAFLQENFQLAVTRYLEAIKSALSLGSDLQVAVLLHSLAQAEAGQGRHEKGLRLFGASNAKLESLEAVIPDFDTVTARFDRTIGRSHKLLGTERSNELDQQGRRMGIEAAVSYAFDVEND